MTQTFKNQCLQCLQPHLNRVGVCRHCRRLENNVCTLKPASVVDKQTLQTLQTWVRVPLNHLALHQNGKKCRKV